jgi:hypothetical protein
LNREGGIFGRVRFRSLGSDIGHDPGELTAGTRLQAGSGKSRCDGRAGRGLEG